MNLLEIVDKRNLKMKELEDLTSNVKLEKRMMNDVENTEFIKMKNEVNDFNKQIESIKEADKSVRNDGQLKNNIKKMENNFSLIKAVREAVNGNKFSDETIEMIEAGKRAMGLSGFQSEGTIQVPMEFEKRADITATGGDTTGGFAVDKDYFNILAPLTANLVFTKAGATYLSGLVGNLVIPVYSGSASSWKDETTAAADGAGTFSQVTFSPKKLTTILTVSKQMLNQDAVGLEAMLRSNLVTSIVTKLENTLLSSGVTSTSQPAGIFVSGATYVSTSAVTFAKVVALEGTVDTANALTGNLCYITHPKVKTALKTTAKFANGYTPIMENDLNGYPVYVTSNMLTNANATTETGLLFANMKDLVIAQWGALDILVDPYTKGAEAEIRLIVTGYWDAKFLRSASYALGSFAV